MRAGPLRHRYDVRAVAFSPDGKTVATAGHGTWWLNSDTIPPYDACEVQRWDTATGELLGNRMLQHPDGWLAAAAFSPDGKTILTATRGPALHEVCASTARLWDVVTGEPCGEPMHHGNSVEAVAFNPDGKTVMTLSDKTVRLWHAVTGEMRGPTILRCAGRVGNHLYSGWQDRAYDYAGCPLARTDYVFGMRLQASLVVHHCEQRSCLRVRGLQPSRQLTLHGRRSGMGRYTCLSR